MAKSEYDTDRDLKTQNAEAQIALTYEHVEKTASEAALFRAKTSAYWVACALLGSLTVKVWFL